MLCPVFLSAWQNGSRSMPVTLPARAADQNGAAPLAVTGGAARPLACGCSRCFLLSGFLQFPDPALPAVARLAALTACSGPPQPSCSRCWRSGGRDP